MTLGCKNGPSRHQFGIFAIMIIFLFQSLNAEEPWYQKGNRLKKGQINKFWKRYPVEKLLGKKGSYKSDSYQVPFKGLLTDGRYFSPHLLSQSKFEKKWKSGFVKNLEIWEGERKDPYLLPAALENWVSPKNDVYILGYKGQNFVVEENDFKNWPSSQTKKFRNYQFVWITQSRGTSTVIKIDFKFKKSKFRERDKRWRKIFSHLDPFLNDHPSALGKKQIATAAKFYPRMLLRKNMNAAFGSYKPSDNLKDAVTYIKNRAEAGVKRLHLMLGYTYKRVQSYIISKRDNRKFHWRFLRDHRKLARHRYRSWPERRLLEEMNWVVRTLARDKRLPEDTKPLLLTGFSGIIGRITLIRPYRDYLSNHYKSPKAKKLLLSVWKKRNENSLRGVVTAFNNFLFQEVENGKYRRKKFVKDVYYRLDSRYIKSYDQYYKKSFVRRLNTWRRNGKVKKAYQALKSWWNEKVKPNLGKWKRPKIINRETVFEFVPVHKVREESKKPEPTGSRIKPRSDAEKKYGYTLKKYPEELSEVKLKEPKKTGEKQNEEDNNKQENNNLSKNEQSALDHLKTLLTKNIDFRNNDADKNRLDDFWMADIWGLYGLRQGDEKIKLIPKSLAKADFTKGRSTSIRPKKVASWPIDRPVPKDGYYFAPFKSYHGKKSYLKGKNDVTHPTRMGLMAFPAKYGETGKKAFIINGIGGIWMIDAKKGGFNKEKSGKPNGEPGNVPVKNFPKDPESEGFKKVK